MVLVSLMVLWSCSLPSRVFRHLHLKGPIPSRAVGWILALLGEQGGPAEVTPGVRQGWSSAPCRFPRGGLVEALKGDSESEGRGQAVVGCPRFAVLVTPAGRTHVALQVEAWAGFVGLP